MKEVIETNEQYHSSDAISASGLKFIAKIISSGLFGFCFHTARSINSEAFA